MLDKTFIETKIRLIKDYFEEIRDIIKLDKEEILRDVRNLRTLERIFQLIVDETIDINLHLIREMDLKSPDDFQSSFEILAEGKILPYDFAIKIAPVVGLRNKLVHRYEKVNRDFFIEQVKREYEDFIKFIEYIRDYLREKNKNGKN